MTRPVADARVTRRALLAGGGMLAAGATAYVYMPRKAERGPALVPIEALLPNQIGSWSFTTRDGIVQTREESPLPGYDQLVTRVYTAPGLPTIMVLIAYGSTQGGSLQLHRPETCYPGEGFRIRGMTNADLRFDGSDPVAAQTFTAIRDERTEHLLYWTRISESFPRTTGQEYLGIMRRVIDGVVPDGVLVRLSTVGAEAAPSMAALDRFATAMVVQAPLALRQVLVGAVRAAEIAKKA